MCQRALFVRCPSVTPTVSRRIVLVAAALLSSAPCGVAWSQPVLLQIRPKVGDTLVVRMDQKVEMTGVPTDCVTGYARTRRPATPEVPVRPCAELTRTMTNVMEVYSRVIVTGASADGALVVAITDSVRMSASVGGARPVAPKRARARSGPMNLRVGTDGGTEVVNGAATERTRALFGQMPAALSRKPVAVGEHWTRQMRIPISAEAGATGLVSATFRLDSLGRNGDVAYISMRGTLSHDHTDGSDSDVDGWLSGALQLDRRLAWITETRAVIDVESMVQPASGGPRMRVRTRITQSLFARPAQ